MAVHGVEGEWQAGRELVPVPDSEAHFPDFFAGVQQTQAAILSFVYDPRAEQLQRAAMQHEQALTDLMAGESQDSLVEMLKWTADDEEDGLEVPAGYAAGQDLPLRSREAFLLPLEGSPLKVMHHEAGAESSAAFSMQEHDGPLITWLEGASEIRHFYFSDRNGTAPRIFGSALHAANALHGARVISRAEYAWLTIGHIPQQRSAEMGKMRNAPASEHLGSITLRKLT